MELNAIQQNYPQLGPDFENLGSPSGLYLRFNGNNDWSVVKLNCFEKFLRWIGFFASTHLTTIANWIDIDPNVPDALISKIADAWESTYPKQKCPLGETVQKPANVPTPEIQGLRGLRFKSVAETTGGKMGAPFSQVIYQTSWQIPNLNDAFPRVLPSQDPAIWESFAEEQFDPASFIDQRPPLNYLDFTKKKLTTGDGLGTDLLGNIAPEKLRVNGAVISIEGGDLLEADVPCIVAEANEEFSGEGAIPAAAGPELRELCAKLPIVSGQNVRCKTGTALITESYDLERLGIDHIIHAVGPRGNDAEKESLLESVYEHILALAEENNIRSLAIPPISTGDLQFPFGKATEIAIRTIERYLYEHPNLFDEIKLVFMDHDPKFYSDGVKPIGKKWDDAIESAKNLAWAIHIARHMSHPYGELEKAPDPVSVEAQVAAILKKREEEYKAMGFSGDEGE